MKKLERRTILTLLLIATMTAGLTYGAIVNYISNTVTKPVDVKSPIELTGTITYKAIAGYEGKTETFTASYGGESLATITKTDDLTGGYVVFTVDFEELEYEHFYHIGLVIATSSVAPDFQVWMRDENGLWYYEEYGAAPEGWTGTPVEDGGKGTTVPTDIEVIGDSDDLVKVVKIPIERLGGVGAVYYWAMQVRTNNIAKYPESWMPWSGDVSGYEKSTVGEPLFELKTADFDGDGVSVKLQRGDEFSMTFEAKNLANKDMAVTLGLVMECPSEDGSEGGAWTPTEGLPEEILVIDPVPSPYGLAEGNSYFVVAYDLDTIGAGQTVEKTVTIQLSPIAANGQYTIKAVVVWTDALNQADDLVAYIVKAATGG